MNSLQIRRFCIQLRLSRWLLPTLCSFPYLGSMAWLLVKGQQWIAVVMLSPALMLAMLIVLTWLLARLEFGGSWRG